MNFQPISLLKTAGRWVCRVKFPKHGLKKKKDIAIIH